MGKTADVIKDLITRRSEEEWFEFKENWFEPRELGEYISALSNAAATCGQESAYFIWGIQNKTHKVVGTKFDFYADIKGEPLQHFLARQIQPDIGFFFSEEELDGNRIVVLTVPAAEKMPTAFDRVRYYRIGSSKVNLMNYPEHESRLFDILRNGIPTIENTASEYQDLTFDMLFLQYSAKKVPIYKRTFKENLGLLTKDGRYNILAQLLSDNSHIPVRFGVFAGTDKSSTMYSVKECGNTCLLTSLDQVLDYGKLLNIPQADERNRRTVRNEIPLFNEDAFREAVVNSFAHNAWIDGNAPMFNAFRDRIEIMSHGSLPPKQTVEGFFRGKSVPVNQGLSNILLQLHISERTGRGVPKITGVYGKDHILLGDEFIQVDIPFDVLNLGTGNEAIGDRTNAIEEQRNNEKTNFAQKALKNERSLSGVLSGVLSEKNYNKVEKLVELLDEDLMITPKQAEMATGKSAATTRRYLKMLTDTGFVIAEGGTNNKIYKRK